MITGARAGRPDGLRRLLARALAFHPAVFVLPGLDIARAQGLDVEAAGLRVAATPRHAEILLIVGELPEALRQAAVVVYAQMVRPRVIASLGAEDISPLPPADVVAPLSPDGLNTAIRRTRELLRDEAWATGVPPFEGEGLVPKRRQPKPAPQPAKEAPGQRAAAGHALHGSSMQGGEGAGMRHDRQAEPAVSVADAESKAAHSMMSHGGSQPANTTRSSQSSDMAGMAHDGMQMSGSKSGGMSMAGMGFMSMVRLTQNQPRSADGLPMEWVQTPLGPFFASLPSGLDLTVWLDGDTVARANVGPGMTSRGIQQSLIGAAAGLPDRLARLDPLAPVAYRLLAIRALEVASGLGVEERTTPAQVAMLERERAASHLNWLTAFGYLLGYAWMEWHAARLHRALVTAAGVGEVTALQPAIERFLSRVRHTPLLERRLRGIGMVEVNADDGARGPVARACGIARDARTGDNCYARLGFKPVVAEGGDALARLGVRMEEIVRSLSLVRAVADAPESAATAVPADGGSGEATLDTPRGAATLAIVVEDGMVREARLDTPTAAHFKLIDQVVLNQELGDALVGVASLDLSPWEANP